MARPSLSDLTLRLDGVLPAVALAAVCGFIQVVGSHFAARGQPDRATLDAIAYLLLVLGPLALVVRRRYPLPVLWTITGVTLAYLLFDYPYGPVFLSFIVSLYTAVVTRHRVAAIGAAAALYFGCFGARYFLDLESPPTTGELVAVGAWLIAVLSASELARVREERAFEARKMREEEAQRRRSDERLRIARELHDVLAHHISLINVQAGVALHLMDKRPEQVQTALAAIEEASRDALSELRSVLDILRAPEEEAPRAPSPGLARLSGLMAQAEAAGLNVRTSVEGGPRPLPVSVDTAAYRIIQEALTNIVRHAGASVATIRLSYRPDDLAIDVEDDGRGDGKGSAQGSGSGLAGMRERVAALGGRFQAGPLPSGGFRVHAEMPLNETP